ncbi:MAG: 4Fe-4S dicluster domain-containing protein, partial [Actinobacteria bacterium]|nr:4Fe-4S dicluster domain-containing protein [Actinomycetota bacterium]
GVHYAMEAGRLAAEAAFAALTGKPAEATERLAGYDKAVRSGFVGKDLHKVRNVRGVFARGFFIGGFLASLMTITRGLWTLGRVKLERDDEAPLLMTARADSYPTPDGKLTFGKLASVFASGNQTSEEQPNHIRIEKKVPAEVAMMWERLCPAQVYKAGKLGHDNLVTVEVYPANCIQCGAITAKGGRLTPPEGGSGPEYVLA